MSLTGKRDKEKVMRKSKVLSFVLVAALAVTAIPINAFGTVTMRRINFQICRIRSNRLRMKIINYRNLSLMHRSTFSQLIRS